MEGLREQTFASMEHDRPLLFTRREFALGSKFRASSPGQAAQETWPARQNTSMEAKIRKLVYPRCLLRKLPNDPLDESIITLLNIVNKLSCMSDA